MSKNLVPISADDDDGPVGSLLQLNSHYRASLMPPKQKFQQNASVGSKEQVPRLIKEILYENELHNHSRYCSVTLCP